MNKVIERIINLLAFLLTVGRPVSAEEIRFTVAGYDQPTDEAFRRMFERDKDLLRGLGIPMKLAPTDHWEVEFGYVVDPDEYQLVDPGLTDEERAALWLAAQVVRVGGEPTGPEAMFKLGGAPSSTTGEPLAANLGADLDTVAALFDAVARHARIEFGYRDKTRKVEPYGLAHRHGHWYVVGRQRDIDEIRVYRVDRLTKLSVGEEDEAFERPKGFRVDEAMVKRPWEAGDESYQVTVRFDADVAWLARRELPPGAVTETADDGSTTASFPVANPAAFIGWIIGFVDKAEILEPQELRDRLVSHISGVASP
ncbi:MAG: WYL domain-containing protein [Acidimicrobiia bacterium]|nr:WYL domain-containing protein [Acidimicrobiia bacterium]NNC42437.1 WYL domain-containing protein [Acidimicrobiia bacterium]